MKKVSIIIPVYNVGKYIADCVQSAINQTLKDIEIICIDDASTDNSLSIIKKYAKDDERIKIIEYKENKSASQGRKDGVMQSDSEYILFLDGDDYLEYTACEELYNEMKRHNVDILHFGTNVINEGKLEQKRVDFIEKFLVPYNKKLTGKNVFEDCFVEKKYRFSLWNKIYKASLCKEAFRYIKDGKYPKAQDLYAFFIIGFFAKSYYGLRDKRYINYRYGAGITGNSVISMEQLRVYCSCVYVAEAIEEFIKNQNKLEQYSEVVYQIRENLLGDCLGNWFNYLPDEFAANGFDLLTEYWKDTELVSSVCKKFSVAPKKIAKKLLGAKVLSAKENKKVETIGIFYHRMALGGVEKVISLLIPMYIEMGYKVVLFTDEYAKGAEYTITDEVKRVVLPSSLEIKKDEYMIRADEFKKHLMSNNIDVMCYHVTSSPKLLFDMMLVKMQGIPFVVTIHEVAFQAMLNMNSALYVRPYIYKLVDYVSVLSKTEEYYWNGLGVNAVYIPNPIDNQITVRESFENIGNCILWIGKLDFLTNNCMDTVEIMEYVVKEVPDAKLLILGNEVSKGAKEKLKKAIKQKYLEKNIELCGHNKDVEQFYKRVAVHILTSVSETFPMTIIESKSRGLPLVMYELPFLEIVQDKRGFVSVEHGDTKAMAREIIHLLKDKNYREQMGKQAHESLTEFKKFDLKAAWKDIIDTVTYNTNIQANRNFSFEEKYIHFLMESMLHHYETSFKNITKLRSKNRKLRNENQKIKNSISYKMCCIASAIPRYIKNGVKRIIHNE